VSIKNGGTAAAGDFQEHVAAPLPERFPTDIGDFLKPVDIGFAHANADAFRAELRTIDQTRSTLGFKGPKNGRARVVALPDSALKSLEDHRSKQAMYREQFGPDYRTDLDLIVANPDGTPLRPDSISGTVSALFRRLKLPKGASLHSLRHTHGSHLLAAGIELPAVSARLGHSSTYVTATVYAHALSGRDDEAARIWDKFQSQRSESGKDRLTQ